MPYEYRKLSPQEREEIISYRRANGYPLHVPPHPFRGAGYYLISAANFEHRTIMSSTKRRTEFEARLLISIKEITEDLIAWVVLPNHYHVLISVQSLDDVSAALKHLHGTISREWNIEDNLTGKRRVWYKFADTCIRNDAHLRLAFNYIHYNPVKHGYVTDPYEWPWSSLRMYYEDKGQNWLQEQWNAYEPPEDFGEGWDDDIKNDCTCPDGRCQESRYYERIAYVRLAVPLCR
jgi:putative transposase